MSKCKIDRISLSNLHDRIFQARLLLSAVDDGETDDPIPMEKGVLDLLECLPEEDQMTEEQEKELVEAFNKARDGILALDNAFHDIWDCR